MKQAMREGARRPGVVGVDYGFVYKDGQRLARHGIRFHVRQKLPVASMPNEYVLPRALSRWRCDVLEARYALSAESPRGACDPLLAGVSVGNVERKWTGTLGLFVTDTRTTKPALLSNWHVLCGAPDVSVGEEVSQPGPMHAGTAAARVVGRLERWLNLDTGYDAAIAVLNPGSAWQEQPFDEAFAISSIGDAVVGMKLEKFGAVSGLTHGYVDGIGGSYQVDYSEYGDSVRWMEGMRIVLDPDAKDPDVSLPGDSGAIWVNPATGRAVGLHFAGEEGSGPLADYALAHPLSKAMSLLDLAMP